MQYELQITGSKVTNAKHLLIRINSKSKGSFTTASSRSTQRKMTSNQTSLTKHDTKSANVITDNQYEIVSNESPNDVEVAKMLAKFDADVLAFIKVEKESGRLKEDGRVRLNIRERIQQILLIAGIQMNTESRTILFNSFGLKLFDLKENILAKECFENSILVARTSTDPTRSVLIVLTNETVILLKP